MEELLLNTQLDTLKLASVPCAVSSSASYRSLAEVTHRRRRFSGAWEWTWRKVILMGARRERSHVFCLLGSWDARPYLSMFNLLITISLYILLSFNLNHIVTILMEVVNEGRYWAERHVLGDDFCFHFLIFCGVWNAGKEIEIEETDRMQIKKNHFFILNFDCWT